MIVDLLVDIEGYKRNIQFRNEFNEKQIAWLEKKAKEALYERLDLMESEMESRDAEIERKNDLLYRMEAKIQSLCERLALQDAENQTLKDRLSILESKQRSDESSYKDKAKNGWTTPSSEVNGRYDHREGSWALVKRSPRQGDERKKDLSDSLVPLGHYLDLEFEPEPGIRPVSPKGVPNKRSCQSHKEVDEEALRNVRDSDPRSDFKTQGYDHPS